MAALAMETCEAPNPPDIGIRLRPLDCGGQSVDGRDAATTVRIRLGIREGFVCIILGQLGVLDISSP